MTAISPARGVLPPPVSRILAIRFGRLGDVILLFPALMQLRRTYPDAHLALLTGTPMVGIARMCPFLDEVIPVDRRGMRDGSKVKAAADIARLVRVLRARRFELVIDFHSFRETNLLAWVSGAAYRIGMKRADRAYLSFCFNMAPVLEDKGLHVAHMFQRVVAGVAGEKTVRLPEEPFVELDATLSENFRKRHAIGIRGEPVVVLYVGASVPSRRWPAERFGAVADHAAAKWRATVCILTGRTASEERIGRDIQRKIGALERVRLLNGLEIAEIAAVIDRAALLISNDTGPMHLGPAVGTPTLGIFSQSLPEHYRPIGRLDRVIRKDNVEDVTVAEVVEVMDAMWASLGGEVL